MPQLGVPELVLIIIVALLIFGPGKLPEIGGALGRSIREFRESFRDVRQELDASHKALEEALEETSASVGGEEKKQEA